MKTCFIHSRVILGREISDCAVIVENGKIIYTGNHPGALHTMRVIDGKGLYLSPGFIDIHVHGGGGKGVMDCDPDSILQMCDAHLAHGTTSILPTTLASPVPRLQRAILAVKEASGRQRHRTILGVHLEGPFLSPTQKGAQSEDSILPVTKESVTALLDTWDGIRMMGAAPELEGISYLAEELRRRKITASVAHSDASFDDVKQAVALGFTDVTHIYSGCSSVTRKNGYRIAGVVEAGLLLNELSVTVIADLKHLPPALLSLIYKCKGPSKISLITDALEPAGTEMADGTVYMQKNGVPAVYEDGVMKLMDRKAFAGSVATMDMLVRNMRRTLGISIPEAVEMASKTPAAVIGASRKGSIQEGYDADLLLFDENVDIRYCMCGGNEVFSRI